MSSPRLRVAAFFTFAGVAHLTFGRRFFEAIIPPWVPGPRKTVNEIAGVAEITGGMLALVPGGERQARRYLAALLLAVFPANVHMALRPEDSGSERIPTALLYGRLPLQFLMIAWVLRALPERSVASDSAQ